MRRSITVRVSVDDGAAGAAHPDAVAVDAAVEIAAAFVLDAGGDADNALSAEAGVRRDV